MSKERNKVEDETEIREIRLTWDNFDEIATYLVNEIKRRDLNTDVVIGNARGGLPLAVYMAHHLGIGTENFGMMSVQRHTDDSPEAQVVDPILRGSIIPEIEGKDILIVEDTIGTGTASLSCMVEELSSHNPRSITAVAMFVGIIDDSKVPIIYCHKNEDPTQRQWVTFPWEVPLDNKGTNLE